MKLINKLKTLFRINHNVIQGEIKEIQNLNLTEEDEAQGKAAAALAIAALAACGVPLGALGQPILEKVLAYTIRDLKEGVKTPDKLIIGRIINEVKAEKQAKSTKESLYENLNKE